MQITPVLFFLALTAVVHAIWYGKTEKQKLHLINAYNHKALHDPKRKFLDERRRLSLFPKITKKFMVSLEHYNILDTWNPTFTRKPLMKNMAFQYKTHDIGKKYLKYKTERPFRSFIKTNILYQNDIDELHAAKSKEETDKASEDKKIKENSAESSESQDNSSKNNVTLHKDYKENDTIAVITNDEVNKATFTTTLEAPEVKLEQNKDEHLLDATEVVSNSKEDDTTADLIEYIFVKTTEKNNKEESAEDSEEIITTEGPEEPIAARIKRSDNVIEEENVGTTVAGYKYTWPDSRLVHDSIYKNINA